MSETTVDTTRLNDMIAQLHDALIGQGKYGDASTILEDEARRWVNQVEKFTPPKTQAQGRAAIFRDFSRAMTPAVAGDEAGKTPMKNRFGVIYERQAQALIMTGQTEHFNDYLKHVSQNGGIFKGWTAQRFNKNLHKNVRDRRGRVQSSKRVFILELVEWKRRLKVLQDRVGWMKAGFRPAMIALGLKVKTFVDRHKNAPGFVQSDLIGTTTPSITIGNTAKGVGVTVGHAAREATRARSEAIRKRIKLVLSGYSRDVAMGIRIHNKERRYART